MTQTTDYEHTLDLDNVVAVDDDEDGDVVRVFVTEKKPEDDLDDDQIVANNVDRDTDVAEVGDLEALGMPEAMTARQERIRPVEGGASEANTTTTAGTGGPYPAKVVDLDAGEWRDGVEVGDIVRLSNLHVYAPPGSARLGQRILQPGPYDGGTTDDEVGRLAGRAPLHDGITADVAARTSSVEESETYTGLDETYGTGVHRGSISTGEKVTKTGRTTGVTHGNIRATSASARIDYGSNVGVITLRDLVFTDHMVENGDSGSPVFLESSGDLVGQIFAGSQKISVFHKIRNAENELGVRIVANDSTDGNAKYVQSLDTTVTIPMENYNLDIVEFTGDKPKAGESITATATVKGNYPGRAYIEVQGERYEADLQADGDTYTATIDVAVTAPDAHRDSMAVDVSGGYVIE